MFLELDFFFFDEIYKIDEDVALSSEDDVSDKIELGNDEYKQDEQDHRAVAFRLALYFLLKKCNSCYLAGPFIELNSLKDGFIKMLEKHNIATKEITFIPTLKNEIDFHAKTFKYSSPFENYKESTSANKAIERLLYTANKLGFSKSNQAIVYCLYPAYTEQHAREFSDSFIDQEPINERLQMFIEHLKNNYNFHFGGKKSSLENWDLVYALYNQIGIHNGKFPKYFQREIMKLFNDGAMSTLFCTSTIVEGVNTNAKTVVVYNNPSGKTDESKKFLLLNINGRAGRYQHHFIGNIVYIGDKSLKIVQSDGISLDFKPYSSKIYLGDIDLENIDDDDLTIINKNRKQTLGFNKQLLPDEVFEQNRLIERKKQERILSRLLNSIEHFAGIESASIYQFLNDGYFENILQIWADIGEIKPTQINAIKWFSINYAQKSYQGVLDYGFKKYLTQEDDEHKFVNDTYRKVFREVKDTVEYQLPRIISLFESLIMKRSEDDKQFGLESFTDIMDFYLTSQAQCFIKDFLLQHIGSTGMLLTARCFLEGLALKRMYEKGKISDLQIELLRHQVHIIEYNYYKEFDDIADKILFPEKLEKDKDDAVKFFQEKLSDRYSKKLINDIIRTNKPFLCDPYTNFRKLVGENLGEEYAKIYGLYSQAIHPSVNDFYMNEGVWQTIPEILSLIMEEYKSLPLSQFTFNLYSASIYASDITRRYENLVQQECKILIDISNVFNSFFDKNYTSDTLMSINLLMSEMCTDKLLGLCEQVKSKWKIALDMFSSFYKCYITYFPHEEHFKLLEEHERVQIKRNLGQDYSIERAYRFYKTLYPNGVGQEAFEKSFLTISGYTVDEKGKTKNLTNIVKDFITKFVNPKAEVSFDRSMLLDYVESQMLSHANGYMWYANRGAWGDVNNIIIGMDMCVMFILESILAMFNVHKTIEETDYYKPIINLVRNSVKRIKTICDEKIKILGVPGIVI